MNERLLPSWRHRIEHIDTDAAGVTHFTRYASLLETVLLETLETTRAGLTSLEVQLVVTELRIKYLAPSRFRDVIVGAVGLDHIGGAHIRCHGTLFRTEADGERTKLVDGAVRLASVSGATGRPIPLPAFARTAWKELMTDA